MKNIPFWLIEGQTHLGMPRGARRSPSINWIILLLIQVQILPPSMHHKWKKNMDFACKTTNEMFDAAKQVEVEMEGRGGGLHGEAEILL